MARVVTSKKACTVNPLKMSQPVGGALAFMGVKNAMPLLHGSQGCTSFGLVLFVRHFREAIPMQTTAMSEVATVLGGMDNVEQAIVNIATRTKPSLIGICSTGVTETKGDDVDGYLRLIRQKRPELDPIALVYVSTPDFKDAFQDGWAKTVTKMVEELVEPRGDVLGPASAIRAERGAPVASGPLSHGEREQGEGAGALDVSCANLTDGSPPLTPALSPRERARSSPVEALPSIDRQTINILPGCHLTPGDLDELREITQAFGLTPLILPDLSGSLDGHMPDDFTPTTIGGIAVEDIRGMGRSMFTIAIGEQMRPAAIAMAKKTGAPFELFDRLTGLAPNDALLALLARISGRPVPDKYRRQRSQLLDAMLDGHFSFGGKRIAIGAEPDLLYAASTWLAEMGCTIAAAVTTTQSPLMEKVPVEEVVIGDLEDLEVRGRGCDLLITHSHGRQAAHRLGIPLFRYGLPIFDRLGAAHKLSVGYRGTRNLIFEIGNLFMAGEHEPTPDDWRQSHDDDDHSGAQASAH